MTLCNDHMETTIMILASGGLGLSVAAICSIIVLVLLAKRGDETNVETNDQTSDPAKETRFTIPDGSTYTISRGDNAIGQDFDESRGKGKMCDASTVSRRLGARFKFTRDPSSDAWTVATDCDGDGNWTSYLTGGSDLIAARDKKTPSTQRWHVACTKTDDATSCSFKNAKSGEYLGETGDFAVPSWSRDPVSYRIE